MRIVTWNCQGAFRKKADSILKLRPDILIIQECESFDKLGALSLKYCDSYWYSDSDRKGIAIFTFSDYKIELLPQFNPEFRFVLPLRIYNNGLSLTLFAIWAMNNKENRVARYIGQVWFAINYYYEIFDSSTLLIGDFNSNKIWDYKDRVGSHSDVVTKLYEYDIHSVYHKINNEEQGEETQPTFYLQRKLEKPYHIDYVFASNKLLDLVKRIEIGKVSDWLEISDHMPIIVELELQKHNHCNNH